MWIFIYLTLAGLVTFLVSGKVIDKFNTLQIELNEYNTLLKCKSCGKFHRKYQEELELRLSENYNSYLTCPRCYNTSILYSGEEFKWMNTHPEFPKLNLTDLKNLKKALENLEQLSYQNKNIEKFLYYHHLLPIENEEEKNKRHGQESDS